MILTGLLLPRNSLGPLGGSTVPLPPGYEGRAAPSQGEGHETRHLSHGSGAPLQTPKSRAPCLSPCWVGIQTPGLCQTSEMTLCFGVSDVCTTQILLPPCEAGARAGPSAVTPARSNISVSDTQGCLGQRALPLGALHPHPVMQTW